MLNHNYIELCLVETETRQIVLVYLPNNCVFRVVNKETNKTIKEYVKFESAYDRIRGFK